MNQPLYKLEFVSFIHRQTTMDNNIPFDINYLIDRGLNDVLRKIIENLTTTDQIHLAATCKNIKAYIQSLPTQSYIQTFKTFNLDIFPRFISNAEIDVLYTVYPCLEILKLDLNFARDHFLDSLQKFKHLKKL